jgi:hypothetical protein
MLSKAQFTEGTHRFELPVSKTTLNCPGRVRVRVRHDAGSRSRRPRREHLLWRSADRDRAVVLRVLEVDDRYLRRIGGADEAVLAGDVARRLRHLRQRHADHALLRLRHRSGEGGQRDGDVGVEHGVWFL